MSKKIIVLGEGYPWLSGNWIRNFVCLTKDKDGDSDISLDFPHDMSDGRYRLTLELIDE